MLHWLVLLLSLPPRPSSVRVRVWRRLRAIGAVPLKSSAYLLPATPERREDFEWLAQEVRRARGEATLLEVDRIDTLSPDQVKQLFRGARNGEYRELAGRYRGLLKGRRGAAGVAPARLEGERVRLARELERIREIDFFDAGGYDEVRRLRETVDMHLEQPRAAAPRRPALDARRYRGKRWVTRPRPHVDRIATAWLVRRFIDPKARFLFAAPGAFPAGAIPFDAPGAEFGHQGQDCTFETVLKRFGLDDRRLAAMAEIVHDIDLKDERFGREETRGLDLALRSLRAAIADDRRLLAQGLVLFDGLYAMLERPGR
jgi:hypothetical protein